MRAKSKKIELGRRIASRRLQQGLSQAAVSRRTGIDPSYLSRIETGKIHPTVGTAMRIADALRAPIEDLLGPAPPESRRQPCPVSHSGRCLLDLIDAGPGRGRVHGSENYTMSQLRLLRRFNTVLLKSSPSVLKAFEVLFGEVVNGKGSSRG